MKKRGCNVFPSFWCSNFDLGNTRQRQLPPFLSPPSLPPPPPPPAQSGSVSERGERYVLMLKGPRGRELTTHFTITKENSEIGNLGAILQEKGVIILEVFLKGVIQGPFVKRGDSRGLSEWCDARGVSERADPKGPF